MLAMLRRLTTGTLVTVAALLGLAVQAGSYLLASPTPEGASSVGSVATETYADAGPHAVGVRTLTGDEAPFPMTYWYPGIEDADRAPTTYAYAINMFGPEATTFLASYGGVAKHRLVPDRANGPYPLVIISHGFAISPGSYGWLAEHLASWGFVVLAPHHRESLSPDALWRSTIERLQDIEATLDFVDAAVRPNGGFEGLVNNQRVAVVGHSYGGYTALASAGARIDPAGFESSCDIAYQRDDPLVFLCDALLPRLDDMAGIAGVDTGPGALWPSLVDEPVDAVVSIAGDAAMFGDAGLAEVAAPMMAIGGTADADSPFEWGTRLSYDHVSSSRKVEIGLEGAGHMVFVGECQHPRRLLSLVPAYFCSDENWDRRPAHDLVRHYATAFLLAELAGDDEAASELTAPDVDPVYVGYRSEGY
jgi:predicted dienelactone hydrolase